LWSGLAYVSIAAVLSSDSQSPDGSDAFIDDSEALVASQIKSIIELKPLGLDFYTASAKKVARNAGAACIMGALGGALLGAMGGAVGMTIGGAKGCAAMASIMAAITAIDAPFAHWSKSAQAAYRARRAYVLACAWLDIDAFEFVGADHAKAKSIVHSQFRKKALKYHPDKLPPTATPKHHEIAKEKLTNCIFAKFYILAFQNKYGVFDPDDPVHSEGFLQAFAGAWAAAFGSNQGPGIESPEMVSEWMLTVKTHKEL
jgi:uncharacterized membrane protein